MDLRSSKTPKWKTMLRTRNRILMVGVVALTPIVVALAARNDVPQTVRATESVRQDDQPALKKSDMIRVIPIEPQPIQIERVLPLDTPVSVPPVILPINPPGKTRGRHVELDTCQRHGMHKVHSRRSWRCKR
jgi:hypothetical protein